MYKNIRFTEVQWLLYYKKNSDCRNISWKCEWRLSSMIDLLLLKTIISEERKSQWIWEFSLFLCLNSKNFSLHVNHREFSKNLSEYRQVELFFFRFHKNVLIVSFHYINSYIMVIPLNVYCLVVLIGGLPVWCVCRALVIHL